MIYSTLACNEADHCISPDKPMVMPGDDTTLTLSLKKDLPLEVNQRFTLREGHITVGTGVVTEIIE